MAQFTPEDRDRARQRVGSATMSLAVLAAGAAGAASILAWHTSTEAASASTVSTQDGGSFSRGQFGSGDDGQGSSDDDDGGRSYQQGGNVPQGGLGGAQPPGGGSGGGGGAVRSQGS